jgi:hypothetical protein
MNEMRDLPWKWRGMSGHFICASECCFHMTTDIGGYRISTIGCYHPAGHGEGLIREVGAGRFYETMVFEIGADDRIVPLELECEGYNDEAAAEVGHLMMCYKWTKGRPLADL